MKRIIVIILFFIFWLTCFSQEKGSVSGYVTDGTTTRKLPDVIVSVDMAGKRAITDQDGFFVVTGLENGEYILIFSHISYQEKEESIFIANGQKEVVSVALFPSIEPLDEFVVEDSWFETDVINALPYIQTELRKEQIDETAARDLGDFMRSSKNISGIRKGGGNIDPVVRGYKFSQLNVHLNQGIRIEGGCPNRMDPTTSHVEIEDIHSIRVIKGPYSLRYGPAMGAVIHLKTYDPEPGSQPFIKIRAMTGYESNWNGLRGRISASGGNQMGYFNFSGSMKEYGNYTDGNGKTVLSSFGKSNMRGQAGVRPFKNHLLRFTAESLKGRDVRFPALPMDERKDDTRVLSLNYQINAMGSVFEFLNLMLYRSDVYHEMDNKQRSISDTVAAITIVDALNHGGRIETGFGLGKGKVITGFDLENIRKDGNRTKYMIRQPGLPTIVETIWSNAEILNLGVFAEYSVSYGLLDVIASARLDQNQASSDDVLVKHPMHGEIYFLPADSSISDYRNFSFSFGATRSISDKWSVSIATGRGVRSPDMTERFIVLLPIGYDRFDYLGNPGLIPEKNNQVDLTVRYVDRAIGYFQINGFYALVNDYITGKLVPPSVQKPLSNGVLGVKQFYNAGNAQLMGFEFSYVSPQHRNPGISLSAAMTRGMLNESLQYVMNPAGQVVDDKQVKNDPLTEIPPFETTLEVYYRFLSGKLVPKMILRAVADQNYVSAASYEVPSPGFFLAGGSVRYRYNASLTIVLGVNNIFDNAYYEHLNRTIVGSRDFLTEPGRSFFVNLLFSI